MNDVVGDGARPRALPDRRPLPHDVPPPAGREQARRETGSAGGGQVRGRAVRFNFDFGVKNGVPERDRLRFALSAYNAGAGGALEGFKAGDSDRRTAGGDYGKAVLGRFGIYQSLLGVAPPPVLQQGSEQVGVEFKEALEAWYERHLPGLWETFRITPGPRSERGSPRQCPTSRTASGSRSTASSARTRATRSPRTSPASRASAAAEVN